MEKKKTCDRSLKSSQRSTVMTDAFFPLNQEVTGGGSLQDHSLPAIAALFGGQSVAHHVLLQRQQQVHHLPGGGQAPRVLVVQRVGGQQRLLLHADLVGEARVDGHDGVRHGGAFGALDELQLGALHHDGVPQDGQDCGAEGLQQLHQLAVPVPTAPSRALSRDLSWVLSWDLSRGLNRGLNWGLRRVLSRDLGRDLSQDLSRAPSQTEGFRYLHKTKDRRKRKADEKSSLHFSKGRFSSCSKHLLLPSSLFQVGHWNVHN